MRPELFRFFDTGFPSYFVLLLSGFMLATATGILHSRRTGQSADTIVDLGLSALLWGVAASRIFHVFFDGHLDDYIHLCTDPSRVDWVIEKADCLSQRYQGVWDDAKNVCHPVETDCFAWAKFWAGGLTYYGGFIGASAAAWWMLKKDKYPFWKAADMAGVAVALGLSFGRMGCLLAGCCFGEKTSVPWALSFPPRSIASETQFKAHELSSLYKWSLPVHPTQIYESAACLLISAVCMIVISPRKRYDGFVFAWFLGLYAVARFVLEMLRADARGGAVGLSTSQLVGIPLIAIAIAIHVIRSKTVAPVHAKEAT